MKPFLCVGYYADNLQRVSHLINAKSAEDAELAFFQAVYDEGGYANGALVAVFPVPAAMVTRRGELRAEFRDSSTGEQVNFGPSFDEENGDGRCDDCGAKAPVIIGCPDGAEICKACFDGGAH